jgi:phosphate transport system substrate-binding protein
MFIQRNRTARTILSGLTLAAGGVLLAQNAAGAQRGGGRLVIKGSDTMLPISQPWVQSYSQKNPNADINLTGGGSSTGLVALINGTCDIANSSRRIRPREIAQAKARNILIKEFPVCRDGLSIVVHPRNPIQSISVEDVRRIYLGQVNNWSQVGGPNIKITASGRDPSSGTYGFFQEDVLKNARYRADMISTPSNNAIANNVANDPGGIGYVGVAYAKAFEKAGKVKQIPVSFVRGGTPVEPTDANVKAGRYPISRFLYNYTAGAPKGLAADYLKFVRSAEGQALVEKVGYVPL